MKLPMLFYKETIPQKQVKSDNGVGYYCWEVLFLICFSELLCGIIMDVIEWLFSIDINGDYETLFLLFGTIITIILFFTIENKNHQRSYESLGLNKNSFFKHYILGIVIGWVMISIVLLMTYVCGVASFMGIECEDPLLIVLFFVAFMIQGFEEELLCRGFMMYGISRVKSSCYGIMMNSLFFAILHLGNDGLTLVAFINLLLCGIGFSLIASYFDNIWVSSGAHSMWNFAQGNLYRILVSGIAVGPSVFRFRLQGSSFLAGGLFGLEGSIATTIVELAVIIIFCVIYQYKKRIE